MLSYSDANPGIKITARVIGVSPDPMRQWIRIDRGEQDGVQAHMAVVTPDGVAGQVVQTTSNAASVMLVTDTNSRIGARVQRGRGHRGGRGRARAQASQRGEIRKTGRGRSSHHFGNGRRFSRWVVGGADYSARADHRGHVLERGRHPGGGHQQTGRGLGAAAHIGSITAQDFGARRRRGAPMKFILTLILTLVFISVESVVMKYLGAPLGASTSRWPSWRSWPCARIGWKAHLRAFVVGYVMDLMSGMPRHGLLRFSRRAHVLVIGRVADSVMEVRSPVAFAIFAMGADLGHALLAAILNWIVAKESGWATLSLTGLPLEVLLTGVRRAHACTPCCKESAPGPTRLNRVSLR